MPDCKEYTGITRDAINRFRQEALSAGAPLPEGDAFTIEKSGVTLSAEYTEATQTLKICIVNKPVFVPEPLVWSVVDQTMQSTADPGRNSGSA